MIYAGIIVALILYVASHYADYLVQADAWAWVLPSWYNRSRRTTSFFPRDHWHWAQLVRNTLWTYLPIFIFVLFSSLFEFAGRWNLALAFAAIPVSYAVTRGVGFSLIRKILNKTN